jgi:hypothetical protein
LRVAGVDSRVAEVEDVYLGEDGSIQCVVTWKSSLIGMDSLAGGELQAAMRATVRGEVRPKGAAEEDC